MLFFLLDHYLGERSIWSLDIDQSCQTHFEIPSIHEYLWGRRFLKHRPSLEATVRNQVLHLCTQLLFRAVQYGYSVYPNRREQFNIIINKINSTWETVTMMKIYCMGYVAMPFISMQNICPETSSKNLIPFKLQRGETLYFTASDCEIWTKILQSSITTSLTIRAIGLVHPISNWQPQTIHGTTLS